MVVRFWEARVASGRMEDALAWTNAVLHGRMKEATGYVSGEVFVADESGRLAAIATGTFMILPARSGR